MGCPSAAAKTAPRKGLSAVAGKHRHAPRLAPDSNCAVALVEPSRVMSLKTTTILVWRTRLIRTLLRPFAATPDLLVHRAIKSLIYSERDIKQVLRVEGARSEDAKKPYDTAAMVHPGEHCSMTERRADDATRDVIDFLKCEYISNHIGEDFEGTIAAVTGFDVLWN